MLMYQDGADEPVRAVRIADTVAEPTIAREGDRLMTQATGQGKIEVFPISGTEFSAKVVDARIAFVRGADDKVDRLVLKEAGPEMTGTRKQLWQGADRAIMVRSQRESV